MTTLSCSTLLNGTSTELFTNKSLYTRVQLKLHDLQMLMEYNTKGLSYSAEDSHIHS